MSLERRPSLDAFRVGAITCVMFAHGSLLGIEAFAALRYVTIVLGVIGVELFFVLSGFLIGRQLLDVGEGKQQVGNFWVRRWFRTLPNYYLFLLVNVLLYVYVFQRPAGEFSLIVFSHNLYSPFGTAFFAESWSLAVEEWFYLLAPLLVVGVASALPRQHRKISVLVAMIAVIVVCTAARMWAAQTIITPIDSSLRKIVLLRLDALAFGVLLAWLERYRPDSLASVARAWWLGALGLIVSIAYLACLSEELAFFGPPQGSAHWLAPLLFTLLPVVCALLLTRTQAIALEEHAWIRNQSQWSYSMYLLHFPLLLLLLHFFKGFGSAITLAFAFVGWYLLTIVGAWAIYRWFEKPTTDLRNVFGGAK